MDAVQQIFPASTLVGANVKDVILSDIKSPN